MALVSEQLRLLEERAARPAPGPRGKKGVSTFSPNPLEPGAKTPAGSAKGAAATAEPGAAKAAQAEAAPKAAPRKPPVSDAEAQLYKKAFDLYYAKDYPQAILKFEELTTKFPSGSYADNCQYWMGECHFAMGNFAKAITSFRKVLTFPETEKADDAQLKLGYCLLRLGERKRAAEEFKKVVSLYPDSEYLERAKEELAKLE